MAHGVFSHDKLNGMVKQYMVMVLFDFSFKGIASVSSINLSVLATRAVNACCLKR